MSEYESLSFEFNMPKSEDGGEDSDPLLHFYGNQESHRKLAFWRSNKLGLKNFILGVFDGLGGAGSKKYFQGDKLISGASIASRLTKETIDILLENKQIYFYTEMELVAYLKKRFAEELKNKSRLKHEGESKLKSTLLKDFPTTIALLNIWGDTNNNRYWKALAVWAGDSRCFMLSPHDGLQQLSKDDLNVDLDELQNLREDSPISNCINGSKSFFLNFVSLDISSPRIFLCASDGCFGYLKTPMHFEYLLLNTLIAAYDVADWKLTLQKELKLVISDDASMCLVAWGWSDFDKMRKDFTRRRDILARKYIQPISHFLKRMDEKDGTIAEKDVPADAHLQQNLIDELWTDYKKMYAKYKDLIINRI